MAGLLTSLEASIPALRRYVATLLGDQRAADDVVHECLVAALRRPNAQREATLHLSLLGSVHRTAVTRLRRKGIRWDPSALNTSPAETPCVADADIASAELVRVFGNLPVELRSVLFLVSVEELSYPAVAEVIGMPIAAVMSLLSTGREQLRSLARDEAGAAARRTA